VEVTVAMVTYRWAWALPHSLASMVNQARKPDEVPQPEEYVGKSVYEVNR
jgi:hypothetical protein